MKKVSTMRSDLICFECGNILSISRKIGKKRNLHHIKDIYCYKCNIVTKHIEIGDSDIYKKKIEYKENRSEEEKFILYLLQGKSNIEESKKEKIKTKLLLKEQRK